MKYTNKEIVDRIIEIIKFNDLKLESTPTKTLNKIRSLLEQRK